MKLALVIRGHVRDGCFSAALKQHVQYLEKCGYSVDLFLHSWSESEAKSSYRKLDRSHVFAVTPELLRSYFTGCNVKKVIIQDDTAVKLYGTLDGLVSSTKCPVISWKKMWAGKYTIMKYVYDNHIKDYDCVVSTRYDMFTNPICITPPSILKKIISTKQPLSFRYSVCTQPGMIGIDNYYCGSIEKMFGLTENFYKKLDTISKQYPSLSHQEEMVYKYAIDNCL